MSTYLFNRLTRAKAQEAGKDAVGNYLKSENGVKHYAFITAITSNSTSTAAVSGSFATTSHATGLGKIFRSNGSVWLDITGAGTVTAATHQADAAALTSATLTDNSAGTANTTVQALADGTTYATDVAAIRNNFADLVAQINALRVDVGAVRTAHNALLDALEANGVIAAS